MKINQIFRFLAACILLVSISFHVQAQRKTGTYYILAPSGLNLRSNAAASSKKLMTIPYGSKVSLIEEAKSIDMKVDNFPGGMAKVKFGDKIGYVFDGFLCKMPAPSDEDRHNIRKYIDESRELGANLLYEKCERDYDGYYQTEETITPYIIDWGEAYLLAQRLYQVPIAFPPSSKKVEESYSNPNKKDYVWDDSLDIKRNVLGEIVEMRYYFRAEGGGRSVSIIYHEEHNSLVLSQTLISD